MKKKIIGLVTLSFVIGACLGILGMSFFSKTKLNDNQSEQTNDTHSTTNSEDKLKETKDTGGDISVERNTTNQKEFDALSTLSKEFIQVFYRNSKEVSSEEKQLAVKPYLSKVGEANLFQDYNYQEGTDMATTNPLTAKIYVNFDSVTGEAVVMAFMIYQTKYEENTPVNAQTIVRIECSKNDEDTWKVDNSEMRLLNQPMPNSYYAT